MCKKKSFKKKKKECCFVTMQFYGVWSVKTREIRYINWLCSGWLSPLKKRNSWVDMGNLLDIIKYVSYSKYGLLQTSLSPLFSSEICRNSFTSSLKQQVDFPEQKQFSLLCKAFKKQITLFFLLPLLDTVYSLSESAL